MMRQLRESTKVIMVVVAISFVALMVFDWAMDLSGRNPGGSGTAVGSVDGREIPLDDYQLQLQNLVDQAREQSPDATLGDEQIEALQEQAWEQVVTTTLLEAEAERRGLDVTDDEVLRFVTANPPAEMRNSPAFQTNGAFDPAKYRQALADPQLAETWAVYEQNVRAQLPLRKLQEQVLAGVAVTDRELEENYRALNEQVRVRYLHLDPDTLIPDSAVSVSEDELREAYAARREEAYARRPSAQIRAVTWEARTTPADTARVRAEVDSLRARIVAGDSFEEVAAAESDDPGSARRGGDLGLFGRGQMVPEFELAAFATPQDSLSQPFLSSFGWHLLQGGRRMADSTGERVTARHILKRIEPSEDAWLVLEDSAAAFAERVRAAPQAFDSLARAAGIEPDSVPPFEQSPFVPGLGRVPEVSEWVFENPAGEVSEPLRSGSSVFVVQNVERTPAGFVPFEEVREELRRELMHEQKLEKAAELEERATRLVRERGLAAAAADLGLTTSEAGPFSRNAELPGIGGGNAFIGAAFALEPGQVAGPLELESGTYYVQALERTPADMAPLEEQRAAYRQRLSSDKAQQTFAAWLRGLREAAEIEDYRDEFLQTASEDAEQAEAPPLF